MKRIRFCATLIFCCGVLFQVLAQKADTAQLRRDSLLNLKLTEVATQLQLAREQKLNDSLRQRALLLEIQQLRSNETVKRRQLEEELYTLRIADSLRAVEKRRRIAALRATVPGYAVAPFGDTLFLLYTKIGPLGPRERAERIEATMHRMYNSGVFRADSLRVEEGEITHDILYNDIMLMSISETEALWHDSDRAALAAKYMTLIGQAIDKEMEQNSLKNTLMRVGEAVLVLLIIGALLWLLNRLFKRSRIYLMRQKERFVQPVQIRNYVLLSTNQIIGAVLWLNKVLKIALSLLLLYLALPVLFSIFPATKGYAGVLISWILSPVRRIFTGFLEYLPNLFTIAVIFLATRYLVRFIAYMATEIENGKLRLSGFAPDFARPTFNIVRFLLYAFMFIVIFPYLPGADSPIFQGVSVFLGVLFSLGSSSTIGNMIAGLVITYMKPFNIGDRIKVGDITGDVMERGLLVTRIRTIKNEDITVPNGNLLSGHIINYSSACEQEGLILHTTVTIGYDVPWKKMHTALIEAALATDMIEKSPQPFVLQTSLDDFYVSYQINAYTREPNRQALIYSLLHQNIQDKCNEHEIEILSPHYRALRDGNMITIPAHYLPKDYVAPGFRVEKN